MRELTDATRSIRRWLSLVLPETYDIQFARDERLQRPSAVVMDIPGTFISSGSAYVRDNRSEFEIFMYPEGDERDPRFSKQEAENLRALVMRALDQGDFDAGSFVMRIPVFDYEGTPWDEGLSSDSENYDYLVISNVQAEARVDPDDDSLYTVVLNLRAAWRRSGDTSRFRGALLNDVRYQSEIQ